MKELSEGFVIKGHYKITRKQGRGTLGTVVYLGEDTEQNSDVIIRIIPPNLLADDETIARFMQGIEIVRKLQHPNILAILDAGEDNDIHYVVSEYKKGFFLDEYLEHRGRLDEMESLRLVKSLADALNYAWESEKIVHRNVSPDTIFVAKGNVPLLTDFDMAKSLVSGKHLTMEGFTVGNPLYMSPEQARGADVDFHSDIYCLGLVLYNLLAGEPPFSQKNKMAVLKAQVSEKHIPIQSKNSDVTAATAGVLDKMLEKDPLDRYLSWKELLADFDALLNHRAPSVVDEPELAGDSGSYKMQAVQMSTLKADDVRKAVAEQQNEKQPASRESSPSGENKTGKSKGVAVFVSVAVLLVVIIGSVVAFLLNTKQDGINGQSSNYAKKMNQVVREQVASVKSAEEASSKKAEDIKTEAAKVAEKVQEPKEIKKAEKSAVTPDLKEKSYRRTALNSVQQIGEALQMYANVFNGKFPEPGGAKGLDLLRKKGFLTVSQVFICPSTGHIPASKNEPLTENNCDYVYVGGLSAYSGDKVPILWSKPGNHKDYGIILYVNGDVEECTGNNWLSKTKVKQ